MTDFTDKNVNDAKKELANMSEDDLKKARQAEKDGKDRSTLIEAIDDEIESRGEYKDKGRKARMETMTKDISA